MHGRMPLSGATKANIGGPVRAIRDTTLKVEAHFAPASCH